MDIAQNTNPPSKLKWIVSDKKNAKYLEKLFEKKGIDIEVEFVEKIVK